MLGQTLLIRLNKIVDSCQFHKTPKKDIKKVLLRDRIVFDIKEHELTKKFLKEVPDKLTLENVIQAYKISEITEDRIKQINN